MTGQSRPAIRADLLRQIITEPKSNDVLPPGVILREIDIWGELDLRGIECTVGLFLLGCRFAHTIRLSYASLPRVVLTGSELAGIEANGVQIANGLEAVGVRCTAPVELKGARIRGQLNFRDATLAIREPGDGERPERARQDSEHQEHGVPALLADRLRVDGDLILSGLSGTWGTMGAIRFVGAAIKGDLDLIGSKVHGYAGPAVMAERAEIGGHVLLRAFHGSSTQGGTPPDLTGAGVVVLRGARIGGQLSLDNATLKGVDVCALAAEGATIDADVYLRKLHAVGAATEGVIRLHGARMGGSLHCHGGEVTATKDTAVDGIALDLELATLGKALHLKTDFLTPEQRLKVRLAGLEYPAVPADMTCSEWISFLRRTTSYSAQPYHQLANTYHAAGREDDARKVLIAQQDHLLSSDTILSSREKLLLRILQVTTGYGYKTSRAVIGLALTTLAAVLMSVSASQMSDAIRVPPPTNTQNQQLAPTRSTTRPAVPVQHVKKCPLVDQIGLGIELAVPLINTTTRLRCNIITSSRSEQWIVALGWVFQILGWLFAALFAAGVSKLIRRD